MAYDAWCGGARGRAILTFSKTSNFSNKKLRILELEVEIYFFRTNYTSDAFVHDRELELGVPWGADGEGVDKIVFANELDLVVEVVRLTTTATTTAATTAAKI